MTTISRNPSDLGPAFEANPEAMLAIEVRLRQNGHGDGAVGYGSKETTSLRSGVR